MSPSTILYIFLIIASCTFSQSAEAAKVTGKLKGNNVTGYSVVSVAKNGRSKSVAVRSNGKFSINTVKGASLHLIQTGNKYFGPIVTAKGSKAYTLMTGSNGDLGAIVIKSGYALVSYAKSDRLISSKPSIRYSKSSGPSGAGKLGYVATGSNSSKMIRVYAASQPGKDTDSDGLPDILDIDDDGDLILDVADTTQGDSPEFETRFTSTLRTSLTNSVNKNISNVTDSQIDSALQSGLILGLTFQKNTNATVSSVNIDCGTLPYCSSGTGTATIRSDNLSSLEGTSWVSYDPDTDGLPNLSVSGGLHYVGIKPGVTRSSLKVGDTLFFKAATSKGNISIPAMLPFYFVTAPALQGYVSGAQNRTVSYPAALGDLGTKVDAPFPLGASTVSFTFWKPQRPAIAGAESGDYIDMGNLRYGFTISVAGTNGVYTCTPSEYSGLSSTLSLSDSTGGTSSAAIDSAADTVSSSTNLLTFTLDLGACLSRQGISTSGTTVSLDLNATSFAGDQTSQTFYMQLP